MANDYLGERIGHLETEQARYDERIKTAFNRIDDIKDGQEKHEERELAYHQKTEDHIDALSAKMDKLIDNQNSLIAMKNKWAGIILAITFIGSVGFTFFDAISNIFKGGS